MKNTFISFLFLASLSLLLSSCTKENNGIDTPTEELKEVEDVCTQMDDINFMNFCYTYFDVNKDGKVSMTEANAVREIFVSEENIKSLIGIEYFTNLTRLQCNSNNLTSLDVSKCINLTELYCTDNPLTIIYMNAKHKDIYSIYPEGVNIEYLDS